MKKFLRIIAPLVVLAVGFGVVQAMIATKPAPEKKEETQRLVSLYVDPVREELVTLGVQTQGEVRPHTEIELYPQVSGRVVSVAPRFAVGAGFAAGETLVKIDDTDYRLALTRAEARVAEANVRLIQEQAAAQIKRQQWESTGRTGEPTPLQVHRPQVIEAEAKLRSAEADLAEAKLNLSRTEIKLPFAGRVRERAVGIGQFVTTGTPLGRVFATDLIEVRLPLTDSQLKELNLSIGYVAPAGEGLPVTLGAIVGNQQHQWHGRIVRTHAAVDRETRLIYAVAEVADPYGAAASAGVPLAVGMFVTAEIEGAAPRRALVMPREALRNADKVYVVNAEEKLEIRTVEVLSTSEERVLVSSGVEPGEQVVTSTIASAVDGMQVQAITRLAQG